MDLDVEKINIEIKEDRLKADFNSYDIIAMCEIFEHLRMDLVGTMEDIFSGMKVGGVLYLTTPNFFFARNFLKRVALNRSGPPLYDEWSKIHSIGHMGHVREYSKNELEIFFRRIGFTIESCIVRNREVNLNYSIKLLIPSLACSILEKVFNRFGQELVFVLKKPSH